LDTSKNRKASARKFLELSQKLYSKSHYFPLDFQIKIMYNFNVITC